MSIELTPTISGAPVRRWKRYPAYRDSGVKWLGEVPEEWKKTFIKRLAANGYKKFIDGDWIESPFITNNGIRLIQTGNIGIGIYKEQGFRYIDEKTFNAFNCTEIKPNDVLLCRLAEPVGRACLAPDMGIKMITSVDVCILKPSSSHNPKFIVYFFSSREYLTHMNSLSRGSTRERISRSMLGNIEFIAPPLPEQRAIAAFLDRETGRIDALIEKKEQQVELLQEKRAALISHAVTKGLDPDVKMKDSGVEWLGEVPEEWKVRKLKHIASVKFSSVDKKTEEGEQPVCLCNYVDVYYNDYITSELDLMKATASVSEIQKFTLRGGDILITKDSESWDDIAVPAYVSSYLNDVLCGYHLAQIRPNISLSDGEYLFRSFYAHGINDQFRVAATGVTRYGLGKYWLDNSLFLVPPLSEQRAIAAFLDRETEHIDTLTTKIQKSISKLREYRTALISAAVTGKIDVREELVS